jgi:endonuclease/exonuclease/phosphatase family metal-dependent hydrolase
VRLETRGDWFDGARGEARVGGRCALLAQPRVGGRATTLAAVHLDSHGSPENRAAEMRPLLAAIDAYDRAAPVVIGGDLNAFSLGLRIADPGRVAAALRGDHCAGEPVPHRRSSRLRRSAAGAWSRCNAPDESTLRHASEPARRAASQTRWFLCRGVEASAPRVVAAVGPATGGMLSDHEAIVFAMGR